MDRAHMCSLGDAELTFTNVEHPYSPHEEERSNAKKKREMKERRKEAPEQPCKFIVIATPLSVITANMAPSDRRRESDVTNRHRANVELPSNQYQPISMTDVPDYTLGVLFPCTTASGTVLQTRWRSLARATVSDRNLCVRKQIASLCPASPQGRAFR